MKKNMFAILVLLGLLGYGLYDYIAGRQANNVERQNEIASDSSYETGIQKGQQAPDFQLADLDGNTYALSELQGKIVFVNFWATWCPPCRVEMPHMQRVYEEHGEDVVMLGVNLTPTEVNHDIVRTFISDQGLTFPIVLDEEGKVQDRYRVVTYPTTYVLDREGVIQNIYRGPLNTEMMNSTIRDL